MNATQKTVLPLLILGALSCGAFAQEQDETAQQSGDSLLGGPDVREEQQEGTALPPDFSGANQRAAAAISAEVWMRVLRALELTEEQSIQIEEIELAVRQMMLEFRRTYGEELREIERLRRESAANGQRPSPEVQQRFAEINKHAPSPVEAQEKIWALLTEEQQIEMSKRLEEVQRRMIEERRRRAAGQQDSDQPMDEMMEPDRPGAQQDRTSPESIDEAGQRRLRFLRQRQLSRPPGAPPTEREREFQFDEDKGF